MNTRDGQPYNDPTDTLDHVPLAAIRDRSDPYAPPATSPPRIEIDGGGIIVWGWALFLVGCGLAAGFMLARCVG